VAEVRVTRLPMRGATRLELPCGLLLTLATGREVGAQPLLHLEALGLLGAQCAHALLRLVALAQRRAHLGGELLVGSCALIELALKLRRALPRRTRCLTLSLDERGHCADGLLLHAERGLTQICDARLLQRRLLGTRAAQPLAHAREALRRRFVGLALVLCRGAQDRVGLLHVVQRRLERAVMRTAPCALLGGGHAVRTAVAAGARSDGLPGVESLGAVPKRGGALAV
jgi:hypothetical protein